MQLHVQASASRIVLSFIISMLGALCAISLNEMYRVTSEGDTKRKHIILWAVAFNIGGVAIWSMHFVGMSAWRLEVPTTGEFVPIQFEIVTTIISFFVGVIFVYIGVRIASSDRYFKELLFSQKRTAISRDISTSNAPLSEIRRSGFVVYYVLFKHLERILIGGLITGGGVCAMHYVGMLAIRTHATIEWDPGYVVLSVVIAVVAASAGLFIIFRVLQFRPYASLHAVGCVVIAIAVCGMHYTGMHAAKFIYAPDNNEWVAAAVSNNDLEGVTYGVFIICGLFDFWVRTDLRHKQEVLDNEVYELKAVLAKTLQPSAPVTAVGHPSNHTPDHTVGGHTTIGTARERVPTGGGNAVRDLSHHSRSKGSQQATMVGPSPPASPILAGISIALPVGNSIVAAAVREASEAEEESRHSHKSRSDKLPQGLAMKRMNTTSGSRSAQRLKEDVPVTEPNSRDATRVESEAPRLVDDASSSASPANSSVAPLTAIVTIVPGSEESHTASMSDMPIVR